MNRNKSLTSAVVIIGVLILIVSPFAYKAVINEIKSPKLTKDQEIKNTVNEARQLAFNIDDKDKHWRLYSLYNEEVRIEQKNIYNEAVIATSTALKTQLQDSIDYARSLISSLSDTYTEKKVTMSVQLDSVQQVIINRAIDEMNYAKSTGKQSDINRARDLALKLPQEFHSAFLPTLDELQQNYKTKALEALSTAEKSRKKKDYNKAFELYLDLVKVEHNSEVNLWALDQLKPRLDKIKIMD